MQRRQASLGILGLACSATNVLQAQEVYPSRVVRVVVPYSAGGGTDNVGRILCEEFQRHLQQSFVVDNRAGANGRIGSDYVAKSAPDGYTLLLGGIGPFTIQPHLESVPYDPEKDFTPISFIGNADGVLLVHVDMPVQNVPELLEYLRVKGDKVSYGSSGIGGGSHMAGELFKSMAKVDMTHIPYKGDGAGLIDLMAGTVQVMIPSLSAAMVSLKSGKVRVLGTTGVRRSSVMPDVKTIAEQGVTGYGADTWVAFYGPAGMPTRTVEVLNSIINKILVDDPVRKKFLAQGIATAPGTSEELRRFTKTESEKWRRVIRERGLKAV